MTGQFGPTEIGEDFAFIRTSRAVRANLSSTGLNPHTPGFEAAASGWALERALAAWIAEVAPAENNGSQIATIGSLSDILYKGGYLDKPEFLELNAVKQIRNDGAHGRWEAVSRAQADLLSSTATKFIAIAKQREPKVNINLRLMDTMDVEYKRRLEKPVLSRLVRWAFRGDTLYNATTKGFLFRLAIMSALVVVGVASVLSLAFSTGWVVSTVLTGGSKLTAFLIHMSILAFGLTGMAVIVSITKTFGLPLIKASRSGVAPANRGWTSEESFNTVLLCELHHPEKPLNLVRFEASCPRCDAPIAFDYGGERFNKRIVGLCTAARSEHIFSFDHRTATGRSLVG